MAAKGDPGGSFLSGPGDRRTIFSWTLAISIPPPEGRPSRGGGEGVGHAFDEPGEHKVTLTVVDADGEKAEETFHVTV